MPPATKTCRSCGRTITWRKKWERNWDEIAFCSDACRRRRVSPVDQKLERALRELLAERPGRATVEVSEAAVRVAPDQADMLIEPARAAARRLVAAGEAEIIQGGRVVDPSTARGRFLVRRRPGA